MSQLKGLFTVLNHGYTIYMFDTILPNYKFSYPFRNILQIKIF